MTNPLDRPVWNCLTRRAGASGAGQRGSRADRSAVLVLSRRLRDRGERGAGGAWRRCCAGMATPSRSSSAEAWPIPPGLRLERDGDAGPDGRRRRPSSGDAGSARSNCSARRDAPRWPRWRSGTEARAVGAADAPLWRVLRDPRRWAGWPRWRASGCWPCRLCRSQRRSAPGPNFAGRALRGGLSAM